MPAFLIKTILALTARLQHEFSKRNQIQIAGRVLGLLTLRRSYHHGCTSANCIGKFAGSLQRKTHVQRSILLWQTKDLPVMAGFCALGWF